MFEKAMNKNTVACILKIRKYAFFNILKSNEIKNCARNFKICKHAFLIFEKAMSKNFCKVFSDSEVCFFHI